jgi:tyrosine-protein phosphatase YwqE
MITLRHRRRVRQDPWHGRPARGRDYHSHLLPGVDDGIADYAEAKQAIAGLLALGFSGAVLTPHIYAGVFDNDRAGLRAHFDRFTAALADDGIQFPLHLAAEYFSDEAFLRLIEEDDILFARVDTERWVLMEFPCLQEAPLAGACMAALVARGYRPVIAHVERYRFVAQAQDEWLARFAAAGAILQADIGALAGQQGDAVKSFARRLAEQGKVDIWGTDLHNPGQLARHIVPGLARLDSLRRPAAALDPISAEAAE